MWPKLHACPFEASRCRIFVLSSFIMYVYIIGYLGMICTKYAMDLFRYSRFLNLMLVFFIHWSTLLAPILDLVTNILKKGSALAIDLTRHHRAWASLQLDGVQQCLSDVVWQGRAYARFLFY